MSVNLTFNPESVLVTDRRFLNSPIASPEVLKVLDVPQNLAPFIRLIDSLDGLDLYHFISTVELSNKDTSVCDIRAITSVNGTILESGTNAVVCSGFPFIPEISVDDISTLDIQGDTAIRYTYAIEGTTLRAFWYANKWFLSTHRRISGRGGRWGGDLTFGEAFDDAFKGHSFDELDKSYVYSMVVSHPAIQLIWQVPEPKITIVNVWHVPTQKCLPYLGELFKQESFVVNDVNELRQVVVDARPRYDQCGVVVTDPSGKWPVKIVTPVYLLFKEARGTEPTLESRFFHLRYPSPLEAKTIQDRRLLEVFSQLFSRVVTTSPENSGYLETPGELQLHQKMWELSGRLHTAYVNRYVKKIITTLPKENFVTLQNIHKWHCLDRSRNIVTRDVVRANLETIPHYYLKPMLREGQHGSPYGGILQENS
jgi:hypothetical protein